MLETILAMVVALWAVQAVALLLIVWRQQSINVTVNSEIYPLRQEYDWEPEAKDESVPWGMPIEDADDWWRNGEQPPWDREEE